MPSTKPVIVSITKSLLLTPTVPATASMIKPAVTSEVTGETPLKSNLSLRITLMPLARLMRVQPDRTGLQVLSGRFLTAMQLSARNGISLRRPGKKATSLSPILWTSSRTNSPRIPTKTTRCQKAVLLKLSLDTTRW